MVILEEQPCDLSLEQIKDTTKSNVDFAEDVIKLKTLLAQKKKTLNSIEKESFIANCAKKAIFSSAFDQIQHDVIENKIDAGLFKNYPSNKKRLALYEFLKASQPSIFYQAIYIPSHQKMFLNNSSQANLRLSEHPRMQCMASNIRKAIRQLQQSGGFIFVVNLGNAHVKRLSYYLHQLNCDKQPITLTALQMFGPLAPIQQAQVNQIVCADEKVIDTPKMLAFYQQFSLQIINCFRNANEENNFNSIEFNQIMINIQEGKEIESDISYASSLSVLRNTHAPMLLFDIQRNPQFNSLTENYFDAIDKEIRVVS